MLIDTMVKDSRKAWITEEGGTSIVWIEGKLLAVFEDTDLAEEYLNCKFLEEK